MNVDLEAVERFIQYGKRPKPFRLRSFYVLLGYDVPEFLSTNDARSADTKAAA